jgi:hypothetical protein
MEYCKNCEQFDTCGKADSADGSACDDHEEGRPWVDICSDLEKECDRLKSIALQLAGEEDAYQVAIAQRDMAQTALKEMTDSYDECLRRARDLQEGDEWNWMGTDEDNLESMSEGMVVRIRAEDLRELLDEERDEYERKKTLGDRLFCKEPLEEPMKKSIARALAEDDMKALPVEGMEETLKRLAYKSDNIKLWPKLTRDDTEEIYKFAMKRSDEILAGNGDGPAEATITYKTTKNQFKVSKADLDKAQKEMPSMVEKIQKLAMGGGALGSIDHQTCRCDQMDGGKLCESCLTVAMNESLMPEPIGPPKTCTCDSGTTDGVCQIHRREDDRTDGK